MNQRPKILICCDCNSRGGVWVYSSSLIKNLVGRGYNVSVVTHEPESSDMEEICHELLKDAHDRIIIKRHENEKHRLRDLRNAIVSLAPQILIPNYRYTFYQSAALATRDICTHIIGVCHDDHESYYSLLRKYSGVISSFVCAAKKTEACIEKIVGRSGDVYFIPHGVEYLATEAPKFKGKEIRILYHGRIVQEQKCIMEVLKVACRLLEANVPYRLTMVGDGDAWSEVHGAIHKLGLSNTTTLLHGQSRLEIGSLIAKSHLAILTSKHEGFCLSLAEAMLAGLPAVIYHCGGVPEEYVEDGVNGFIRPWGDSKGLAHCVSLLQEKPELWDRFSKAAREGMSNRFNWERVARSYEDLFNATIKKPRRVWSHWRNLYKSILHSD